MPASHLSLSYKNMHRRDALKLGGATVVGAFVSTRRAWAADAGDTLNVAAVGAGGQGRYDLSQVASAANVRIVALCDVDSNHLGAAAALHPWAAKYADYRKMFDAMHGDIDAVLISTPDHMHAPIAKRAMSHGKHVYLQKPLTHSLAEMRELQNLAGEKNLVTQMGTQIHSAGVYRTAVEWARQGVIGPVSEAYLWVGKSWSGPSAGRPDRTDPVPDHLDWDLWLGVAPERPYVDGAYHPANWRRWCDFGTGTLGDMGCHILDPVKGGLDLGPPMSVISRGPGHTREVYAPDGDVTFTFPGTRYTADKLTLHWFDGGQRPPREKAQLPEGVDLPGDGSLLIGEQGTMTIPHISNVGVYRNGEPVDVSLETLGDVNHYHEWADACRGEGQTSTPFSYAGPVTESILVGVVAGHFPGQQLHWNSAGLEFDSAEANARVSREYREGWA